MSVAHKTPKNQALSLILTLLIISSILTGTVLVAEVTIRHSQVVQGAEISEKAFFAAETAIEKTCYEVFKNYEDISSFSLSGTMTDEETEYSATVSPYNAADPWEITLDANESFQLDINLNGAVYPASIDIDSDSNESDIVVYECTTGGSPRVCFSGFSQTFSIIFPYTFTISGYESKYYKLRINNTGDSEETYTLDPSGDLPIGIEINAAGTHSGYERKIITTVPKWQKYGI